MANDYCFDIAQSLECQSCHTLRNSGTLYPGLKPHQCLYMYKYMDQNSSATILATNRSAGVAPEVNLRNPLFTGDEACKQGIRPSFEPYHQTSPVQNMGISGPTKRTDVPQNSLEKSCSFGTQPILCLSHTSVILFTIGLMDPQSLLILVTGRKRSLGQGNVFIPVCHSVHRGSGRHPREDTPQEQTSPREQTPPAPMQCMLGDTGNKRVVRILMECILVGYSITPCHVAAGMLPTGMLF